MHRIALFSSSLSFFFAFVSQYRNDENTIPFFCANKNKIIIGINIAREMKTETVSSLRRNRQLWIQPLLTPQGYSHSRHTKSSRSNRRYFLVVIICVHIGPLCNAIHLYLTCPQNGNLDSVAGAMCIPWIERREYAIATENRHQRGNV